MNPVTNGVESPTWIVISQNPAINYGVSEVKNFSSDWKFTPSFWVGNKNSKKWGFIPN